MAGELPGSELVLNRSKTEFWRGIHTRDLLGSSGRQNKKRTGFNNEHGLLVAGKKKGAFPWLP